MYGDGWFLGHVYNYYLKLFKMYFICELHECDFTRRPWTYTLRRRYCINDGLQQQKIPAGHYEFSLVFQTSSRVQTLAHLQHFMPYVT